MPALTIQVARVVEILSAEGFTTFWYLDGARVRVVTDAPPAVVSSIRSLVALVGRAS